jgi:type IV pilus assembly protein PilZ
VGTEFHFRLRVPGRPEPFSLSGKVARVSAEGEEAGMGIRFAWADEARRREFEEEVERLMAETLGPELVRAVLGRPR